MFLIRVILVGLLLAAVVPGSISALRVAVKKFRGAPQLMINGRPQVPLSWEFMSWSAATIAPKVDIGPDWQRVVLSFTASEDTPDSAGFQIRMGIGEPGQLWVDDLRYYEGTPDAPLGPNMQPHGDFEDTGDQLPPDWGFFVNTEEGAQASWNYDEQVAASGRRSLHAEIQQTCDTWWYIHFYLGGCRIQKDHTYTVEVSLRADPPRTVELHAMHQGPPWTGYVTAVDPIYLNQVRLAAQAGVHHHQLAYPVFEVVPYPAGEAPVSYYNLDRGIRETIAVDPQAIITLRIFVGAPDWWRSAHPDECITYEDGSRADESPSSQLWLDELRPRLTALIQHCEQRWGDRFVIYFPSAMNAGEWYYSRFWEDHLAGFGPVELNAFREWAAGKYQTPAALSRAWGQQIAGFEDVQVPTLEQRTHGALGQFYHPATDRYQIDFQEFLNRAMADALEQVCAMIKDACGGRKPVLTFYGYLFDLASSIGLGHSGHLGLSRLLRSSQLDAFASPISYGDREPGDSGPFMTAVDSFALHGKLWFNEDDTRTYLTPLDVWPGRCADLEQSRWVHQRNFAQIFPRRMGCWYMDLGSCGWLNDAGLWDNIARLQRLWQQHLEDEANFAPEIAVISDERSPLYSVPRTQVQAALLTDLRYPLNRIGAPVGWYLLEDFLAGKVNRAKLYIFNNAFVLTAQERHQMRQILKEQKATALWFYAPGFIDPHDREASNDYIEQLTGMRVYKLARPREDLLEMLPQTDLAAGISEPFGSHQSELSNQWAVRLGKGVSAIAAYTGDESLCAVAQIQQDGWRSVYIASLYAPPALLRNLAREAGVHIYCESDDVVLGDNHFLAIHANSAGEKLLRLPRRVTVRDCLTGADIARGRAVPLTMALGETRLFWLEPEDES